MRNSLYNMLSKATSEPIALPTAASTVLGPVIEDYYNNGTGMLYFEAMGMDSSTPGFSPTIYTSYKYGGPWYVAKTLTALATAASYSTALSNLGPVIVFGHTSSARVSKVRVALYLYSD